MPGYLFGEYCFETVKKACEVMISRGPSISGSKIVNYYACEDGQQAGEALVQIQTFNLDDQSIDYPGYFQIFQSCDVIGAYPETIQALITAPDITYIYVWGLGAVLAMWAIGYAVGSSKTVINKV